MDGPPPIRYVASADGVRLAYWTMGEGPPVMWLQELGFSHLSLEWELPRMEETYLAFAERHQLIRIDLRNQGLSSRGVRAVSDADLVTDILTVMERLGIARSSFWTTNGRDWRLCWVHSTRSASTNCCCSAPGSVEVRRRSTFTP